jgi:membrane-associated protease RseP (regulator of RpoE activity)
VKYLIVTTLLIGQILAAPLTTVSKALENSTLNNEEKTELVRLVVETPDSLISILEEQLPPKLAGKGKALAMKLQETPSDDSGANPLGARVGWHMQFVDDKLTSYPTIGEVIAKSPAERAKFRIGDVIVKAEGVSLHGPSSRNLFMNLLKIWPSSNPMKIDLLRNPHVRELDDIAIRGVEVKSTVHFGTAATKPGPKKAPKRRPQ